MGTWTPYRRPAVVERGLDDIRGPVITPAVRLRAAAALLAAAPDLADVLGLGAEVERLRAGGFQPGAGSTPREGVAGQAPTVRAPPAPAEPRPLVRVGRPGRPASAEPVVDSGR